MCANMQVDRPLRDAPAPPLSAKNLPPSHLYYMIFIAIIVIQWILYSFYAPAPPLSKLPRRTFRGSCVGGGFKGGGFKTYAIVSRVCVTTVLFARSFSTTSIILKPPPMKQLPTQVPTSASFRQRISATRLKTSGRPSVPGKLRSGREVIRPPPPLRAPLFFSARHRSRPSNCGGASAPSSCDIRSLSLETPWVFFRCPLFRVPHYKLRCPVLYNISCISIIWQHACTNKANRNI